MTTIRVETGCRLHFGLLSQAGKNHGRFAGVGMMLDTPGVRLVAKTSPNDHVVADQFNTTARDRVRQFVARFRDACPLDLPKCEILVESAIPSHAGLGSGTQLGLATATALLRIGKPTNETEPWELADWVGRGRRSGIGIAGSLGGGLLIDHGERGDTADRVQRIPVPDAWRVVLVTPLDETGLSGADELQAFAEMPDSSQTQVDHLWQLATEVIAPSLQRGDFAAFSEAIYQYGFGVGQTFAAVQGGPFANPTTSAIVEFLRANGVRGVGQTSWGPTVFALATDRNTAGDITKKLHAQTKFGRLAVHITRPRNTGLMVIHSD